MRSTKKYIAVLLSVFLLAASLLSVAFIVENADHECSGEHCEICLEIAWLTNTLEQLGTAVLALAAFTAVIISVLVFIQVSDNLLPDSLVSLKVKLNN